MNRLSALPTNIKRGVLAALVVAVVGGAIAALVAGGGKDSGNTAAPASNTGSTGQGGLDRSNPRSVMVAFGQALYRCDYDEIFDLMTGKRGRDVPISKAQFVAASRESTNCKPRPVPKIEALLNGQRYGDFQSVIVRVTGDPTVTRDDKFLLVRKEDGWRVDYPTSTGDEIPTPSQGGSG